MKDNTIHWSPFSNLRQIDKDISGYGYRMEYIANNEILSGKICRYTNTTNGRAVLHEWLEVKEEAGGIFFRESDYHKSIRQEYFITQYGTFINHDNGEFTSWLSRDDKKDFGVEGNFCEMFDCGEYSYAISNLNHMGIGWFKIIRIDNKLETVKLYDTREMQKDRRMEYLGCYQNKEGYEVICKELIDIKESLDSEYKVQLKTIIFQMKPDGSFGIKHEWDVCIPEANSFAVDGDCIYFGNNKMVTRLHITSGEVEYYTNKNDEELAELGDMTPYR